MFIGGHLGRSEAKMKEAIRCGCNCRRWYIYGDIIICRSCGIEYLFSDIMDTITKIDISQVNENIKEMFK
jgi:hypothetical protein